MDRILHNCVVVELPEEDGPAAVDVLPPELEPELPFEDESSPESGSGG
ncbi:hypothetical protein [Streptomyces sp. NPDC047079]